MFDASAGWIIVTMVGLMAGCAAALIGKWFNRDTIQGYSLSKKVSHFSVRSTAANDDNHSISRLLKAKLSA